jgi:uroporphyrinogen-III decarboxylase
MVDSGDPICEAASLFDMETYTVIAFTEQKLFTELLERIAPFHWKRVEKVAREFPGRLWRICGSEYASEPYLSPGLYREYVGKYTGPMVRSIKKYGGYPRLHSHGRLKAILPHIIEMGVVALDPVEPPPQGDAELAWIVSEYGKDLVIFGNLEITDIENMETADFAKIVEKSLRDGSSGGKGFVLMPSACPYGRKISERTLANYRTMVEKTKTFRM